MTTNDETPQWDTPLRPVAAIKGPGETVYVVLEDGEMLQYFPGENSWYHRAHVPYTAAWYEGERP